MSLLDRFVVRWVTPWILFFSLLGYVFPAVFISIKSALVPLLGLVMFGMRMTLTPGDFLRIGKKPRPVLIGILAQYVVMPLGGAFAAWVCQLEPQLAAGVILVGSCPGGTASNVITYLARGDVALSVTVTSLSTLLAPVVTPVLTLWLAGKYVSVPVWDMFISISMVILVPVVLGVSVRHRFGGAVERISPLFPALSVLAVGTIIAIIVSLNGDKLGAVGGVVFLAVVIHNSLGLLLGYLVSRVTGLTKEEVRAITFEVGMQNSGLGVALAFQHFSPTAALPGAVFSIWHNLSGSGLAHYWRFHSKP